ncbi:MULTISPECIES: AzlC family ABC transporter permease [unclassified Mesorhizobium]|jgi:4-azaleucine resistance transporter AzlC|uniref:AzlC family ABC transporter permease n=1 Tax=unclassified Mesorhizobium TaxID=325217 RepID=UPI000FE4140F|nr:MULTISPECIES: AzlC family ABC transporter permease [unclassified Mesorhizobium]MDG4895160.1 AzlC family ABC transporter permease [Mesorhizobium sp. WSM4976]RWH68098.1 MAG: branched-chain amino acid ABC transporter permease [Mesorhizobium sp.]RWL23942.1 MAG: branched-chain amino acid ABC transporter permease [Mesorhizobium sp.]RWL27104.1 MAG: branched-chain amino acid ABC transporter permease [Mesorhizobium sp.]RWL35363.1 MAG: branched-chain amino acid ABC transporter permease [Mesorhizobium
MSVSEIAVAEGQATNMRGAELRRGLAASVPVLLGIIPYALVLGAQAAQKGLGLLEVPLMTGLNFAGGSEFAAIQLWSSPPHILLIAGITLLVNSRHFLMGAALAPFIKQLPKRRVFPALFLMCDESWAVGLADAQRRAAAGTRPAFSLPFYLGAALPFYLAWVAFTTCGAALGPVLGDVEKYGFAMAFPAVFLVLLRGMWKGFAAARPWLVSLAAAALTYLLVPGAWYVAVGALSGLVAAWFLADET